MIHVVPELSSPHGFLRARACSTLENFHELTYQNKQLHAQVAEGVLKALNDPELPVRVFAATAVRVFFGDEDVQEIVIANLGNIIQQLLAITHQVDVDMITHVLEELVETYADQLAPYAVQLCEQLRDAFLNMMNEVATKPDRSNGISDAEESDFSDKLMSASGLLKTTSSLLISLDISPELLAQLEPTLLPVISLILENSFVGMLFFLAYVFRIIR